MEVIQKCNLERIISQETVKSKDDIYNRARNVTQINE